MLKSSELASVGIAAVGIYIPAGVETSRDMAEKSGFPEYVFVEKIGILRKPVASPEEHPSDMGAKAALDALRRAQIRPEKIDLVLFCGAGLYDYGLWSPAARIQHALGASRAFAYEVKNGCNGGNLGLYLASRQLLADPDLEYALVVCSDIFSRLINYADARGFALFTGGDGATAAVLQKNHPGNRLLSFAGMSDGSLVDAIRVPLGGTRQPWSAEGAAAGLGYWIVDDPDQMASVFSDVYLTNYVTVVREALRKCGRSVSEIDFLFTNQVKKSTLEAIFSALGLSPDKTCHTMESFGHQGSSDILLGLAQSLAGGRIRDGDLVVLASSGIGFNWAATVVQY
ncbi:MAG TPA: 3-oxoacyl-[acyl-carrier-protein] synthase III C-terminal domain-containing protein [Thermoanaerobaculia bacterium]|nr:3-oxoacyl-[acyl-carrier-protein] synthase III C-terminal domain-containing protein [Thermoanaerobaculia bacterium]